VLAISISFIGIVVIATRGDIHTLQFENPAGVALALASTVIWSFFWIFNMRDKRDEVIKLFLNFFFGFFYILAATLWFDPLTLPGWRPALGVVYIGIFEMGVAYVFWLKGLQLSSTTAKVSNLLFIAPFISLILINIFVGEPLLWTTLAGLAFIILGIVLQRRFG
jgi:drug/metabolite transporter (DMT)-like permease